MKITLAQLNPMVGDIRANLNRADELWSACHAQGSDLLILSELFLVGYPPQNLLAKPAFLDQVDKAINELLLLSNHYQGTGILLGSPLSAGNSAGRRLHNSAILIYQGEIILAQHKSLLPSYDEFDEARYFIPSPHMDTVTFKGARLGISIGEDAWQENDIWMGAVSCDYDPIKELAQRGIDLLINISATPYFIGQEDIRFRLMSNHAHNYSVPMICLNQVGANDELIFDGRSMFIDKDGQLVVWGAAFKEDVLTIISDQMGESGNYKPQDKMKSLYQSLVLGIRDYFRKTGFSRAIIGLSGGIDSAVTACLAVEALGYENVLGISMPSVYSSTGSVEDSRELAVNLNIDFKVIPITTVFTACLDTLNEHFAGSEPDTTEENIQARIRGNLLMAFANKYNAMVLPTGNKSEIAVGYCTLYGDMCGGLSVLADVPKTMVYELTSYINRGREVIPRATVEKEPSAELRPGQKDQDTLPPYSILDAILNYYVEKDLSPDDIIEKGFDKETVNWVIKTVIKNEYKRKQAAPGLKVSPRALGSGRRMPVASRYYF
ncbi:MAG: NAD+ synthase [Syntrophomonas sp.]|nr:NAD+ synthase [Syntrophomonas sp.]